MAIQVPFHSESFDDLLDATFPFYLSCNGQMEIERIGRSLAKLLPGMPANASFDQFFEIKLPATVRIFSELAKIDGQVVVLAIRHCNSILRGQIFVTKQSAIFLVSLRSESAAELGKLGIGIGDYAGHDAAMELLFMKQAQSTQLNELQEMIAKLETTASEKQRLESIESALMHDLDVAADIIVRFNSAHRIIECRSVRESYWCNQIDPVGKLVHEIFPELDSVLESITGTSESTFEPVAFEFDTKSKGKLFQFDARVAKTLDSNFLLLARDVTQQKAMDQKLKFMALHDPLTDIGNRILFEEKATDLLNSGSNFAILIIDVNDFKTINDNLGHHVGDEVLRTFASKMKLVDGNVTVAARVGGYEFGILLNGISDKETALDLARQLNKKLTEMIFFDGVFIEPRASIGIAISDSESSFDQLMRDADFAMYAAKNKETKSSIVACDKAIREKIKIQMQTRLDLQSAIKKNQFINYYQPVVDLNTGKIASFEALVRWQHPTRGLLTPYHFVELAEENGMIADIGKLVLKMAFDDLNAIHAIKGREHVSFSVNVAASQIQDPNFIQIINQSLEESNCAANKIILEITESALISDFDKTQKSLIALRQKGIRISLDDFGVG
ncbi:MAG: EAL domain-containing protein, partial [Planctomycetota bacterium]